MNTKGIKFLAVLAVLAMAFAAFAVIAPAEENDAAEQDYPTLTADNLPGTDYTQWNHDASPVNYYISSAITTLTAAAAVDEHDRTYNLYLQPGTEVTVTQNSAVAGNSPAINIFAAWKVVAGAEGKTDVYCENTMKYALPAEENNTITLTNVNGAILIKSAVEDVKVVGEAVQIKDTTADTTYYYATDAGSVTMTDTTTITFDATVAGSAVATYSGMTVQMTDIVKAVKVTVNAEKKLKVTEPNAASTGDIKAIEGAIVYAGDAAATTTLSGYVNNATPNLVTSISATYSATNNIISGSILEGEEYTVPSTGITFLTGATLPGTIKTAAGMTEATILTDKAKATGGAVEFTYVEKVLTIKGTVDGVDGTPAAMTVSVGKIGTAATGGLTKGDYISYNLVSNAEVTGSITGKILASSIIDGIATPYVYGKAYAGKSLEITKTTVFAVDAVAGAIMPSTVTYEVANHKSVMTFDNAKVNAAVTFTYADADMNVAGTIAKNDNESEYGFAVTSGKVGTTGGFIAAGANYDLVSTLAYDGGFTAATLSAGATSYAANAVVYGNALAGKDVKITAASTFVIATGAIMPASIESELATYEGKMTFSNAKAGADVTVTYAAAANLKIKGTISGTNQAGDDAVFSMTKGKVVIGPTNALVINGITNAVSDVEYGAGFEADTELSAPATLVGGLFVYGNVVAGKDISVTITDADQAIKFEAKSVMPSSIASVTADATPVEKAKIAKVQPTAATDVVTVTIKQNDDLTNPNAITIDGNITLMDQAIFTGTLTTGDPAKNTSVLYVDADGVITIAKDAAVKWNIDLALSDTKKVVIGDRANVTGTGSIDASAAGTVIIGEDANVTITIKKAENMPVNTYEQLVSALATADLVTLNATFDVTGDINMIYGNQIDLNGKMLTIPAGKTLTIKNSTVFDTPGTGAIVVKGQLVMDGATVKAIVNVDDAEYTSYTNTKTLGESGTLTHSSEVGFADTLTFDSVTITNLYSAKIWGNLIINGTNNINAGGSLTVYKGGNVDVKGTLNIQGTFTNNGKVTDNGTVTVTAQNGDAAYVNNANATTTVASGATFEVLKSRSVDARENKLTANGTFTVKGTLNITGTFQEGSILDMGTVQFNGTSANAANKIVVYDGVEITIGSVLGTLVVTDKDNCNGLIKNETGKAAAITGNTVTLTDVKNVTIYETVESVSDSDYGTQYSAHMIVSGSIVKATETEVADKTVVLSFVKTEKNNADKYPGAALKSTTKTSLNVEDVTVGSYVVFEIGGTVTVAGDVFATAEHSGVKITNAASVTVDGSITIGNKAARDGDYLPRTNQACLNAAAYTVTPDGGETSNFYTNLADAILLVDLVDENEIAIFGKIAVEDDIEIPKDAQVIMQNGSEMKIKGEMDIVKGGLLNASNGTVNITGMLFVEDSLTGLVKNNASGKFVYQVMTESGDSVTYTGLVLALKSAQPGDNIIIQQDATIDASTTIPEDVTVTVSDGKKLIIGNTKKAITVTINGVLDFSKSSALTDLSAASSTYPVTIVINGVIVDATAGGSQIENFQLAGDELIMNDYAAFHQKVSGQTIYYASNLEFAAETFTGGSTYADSILDVYGVVTVDEIALVPEAKKSILLYLNNGIKDDESSLTASEITLGDNAAVMVVGDYASISARILFLDDNTAAAVALTSASGVIVGTEEEELYEVKNYYLEVTVADDYVGTINLVSGPVIMNTDMDTTKDNKITVSADATVIFAESKAIKGTSKYPVKIDGSLAVLNGATVTVSGYAKVAGEIYVTEGTLLVTGTLEVLGTAYVSDEENVTHNFNVSGVVKVGVAPKTTGDAAAIDGKVKIIGNGYVKAYAGADMSAAQINWNDKKEASEAIFSEYEIDGATYMVVFVDANSAVTNETVLENEMTVEGYVVVISDKDKAATVGSKASFDFETKAMNVGVLLSVGAGLTMYIDGVNYDTTGWQLPLAVGSHTVSFDVLAGYDGSKAKITFNGVVVSGTIIITPEMTEEGAETPVLAVSGAEKEVTPEPEPTPEEKSEWTITTILLVVLVVLIAILVVVMILRMNRS